MQEKEAFFQCLEVSAKDAPTIVKWFDEFVNDIPMPNFRAVAEEVWDAEKEKIATEGFDIERLLQ